MNHLILAIFFLQAVSYLVAANDDIEVEIHSEDEGYLQDLFESLKKKHNKTYNPDDKHKHFQTLKEHCKDITKHNRAFKNGTVSWHLKLNHHFDKSKEEFAKWLGKGLKRPEASDMKVMKDFSHLKRNTLPAIVDLRSQIPPIKDQQQCGSCWTFSTVVTLENQWFKLNGSVISLSEEQVADCTYSGNGCDGGWPSQALETLTSGIETEAAYPYGYYPNEATAQTGTCKFNKAIAVPLAVTGVHRLKSEAAIQNALANIGVVSICVDASHFQFYGGGIYNDNTCSQTQLDHAVALVGYNITGNYYILRNSWNTWWGENGYMRIAMGSNTCGLADMAVYPTIKALNN